MGVGTDPGGIGVEANSWSGRIILRLRKMAFFKEFVAVADWAWAVVSKWPFLAQDTVGKQLVRAIDRVGATLVEGDGRYSDLEACHFFSMARGSARETRYWIERSVARDLLERNDADRQLAVLLGATRQLNALIRYRRRSASNGKVRESLERYDAGLADPFVEQA